ncbi:MAG: TlpA family protein disulfide reductase [Candidatus Latescibacteria bacterium]|nr:TlpA family protein disulfide reductase [Candidatus Latescibacterota bacterium]
MEWRFKDTSLGRVEATIEDGWLHARRFEGDGQLLWHIVLGRARAEEPPTVTAEGGFEVRHANNRYFVRDNLERISCVHERLAVGTDAGIDTLFLADAEDGGTRVGENPKGGMGIGLRKKENWAWVILGPGKVSGMAINFVAAIRLAPMLLVPEKTRIGASGRGDVKYVRDEASITDDGEFLQARYVTFSEAEAERNRRELAQDTRPPELDGQRWLNLPPGHESEYREIGWFRGRVVLLDFWATWCGTCVEKLPYIQTLHEKYAGQGLVVIAMHSAINNQAVDAFLAEHQYTMPVILDTGETARRYGVEGIPQYVLIGKDGTLVHSGLQNDPPTEAEIEALLKAAGT